MVGGVEVFCLVKSGALVAAPELLSSSVILKLIMSTILDTSFLMLSGRLPGIALPTSFKLQRYIANANSGK